MKRIGSLIAILMATACGGGTPAAQAPSTAQWDDAASAELKAASEAILNSWAAGDIAALSTSITDDGYLTSYDLDMMGQPIAWNSKSDIIAFAQNMSDSMKAGGGGMTMKVNRVDCKATATFGVCINEMEGTFTMGGKSETMSFRGTGTARKGDDGWKWTHWHGSLAKLPPMPAAASPVPAAAPGVPAAAMPPVAMKNKDLKWMTPPGAPPGLKVAVTWGDPMKSAFAGYVEFPKGTKFPRHYHDSGSWVHVIKGSMKVTFVDGRVVDLKEGDFGFAPAKLQHTTESPNGCTLFQYSDGPETMIMTDDQGKPLPPPVAPAPAAAPAKK